MKTVWITCLKNPSALDNVFEKPFRFLNFVLEDVVFCVELFSSLSVSPRLGKICNTAYYNKEFSLKRMRTRWKIIVIHISEQDVIFGTKGCNILLHCKCNLHMITD